jgi:hypothetical protein
MTPVACMGGWCSKRQECDLYAPGKRHQRIAERLCEKGKDGLLRETLAPAKVEETETVGEPG